MSASCGPCDSTRPILLATLGGAVVSIIVCAGALQRLGAAPNAAASPAGSTAPVVSRVEALATPEVEFVRTACASSPSSISIEAESALPFGFAIVPITRAKERDLRAAFVAIERAEPGALDARAAAILSGRGPASEKVALLRALRDMASPATAHWLDVAVRMRRDQAGADAQSLPTFALEQLTALAANDADACAALRRLAFDAANVAVDLRRRASAGYATVCSPDSLSDLSGRLWREQDELVIESALSALEARQFEPQAQRVLAVHQHTRGEMHVDEAQSSN